MLNFLWHRKCLAILNFENEKQKRGEEAKRQTLMTESTAMEKLKINPVLTKKEIEATKKITFLLALIIFLALPMASYAETAQECSSNCVKQCHPLGSGKEYATCLENCLKGCYDKPSGIPDVPPPKPAPKKPEADIRDDAKVLSVLKITDKLCCYDDRRIRVGKCDQLYPFFHVLNGQCYSTLEECKEHDGDANRKTGMGFCIQCIECFPGST